ncbi:MAG: hypothetical protein GY868_10335, partial [Deltaproteobacteria bacterium]|nr:hypothetical protein [Deltaproteobacteria bacterium]
EADAALLIGDDALRVCARPGRYLLYDLGEEWTGLTGEKMVYAVWAVRSDYAAKHPETVSRLFHAFERSLDMSIENLDQIAWDIALWETFSKAFLKDYFRTLKYEFGDEYQRGLKHYYTLAKKIGAISKIPNLAFVDIT